MLKTRRHISMSSRQVKQRPPAQDLETRISKFASKVLRHEPGYIGLELSSDGWASINQLLSGFAKKGLVIEKQQLLEMVKNNGKQRFEVSGDKNRIRAVQGHSIGVELGLEPQEPPQQLYHGTVAKFVSSIRATGLQKGSRDYVHLSKDRETAISVGSRRGTPIILQIDADKAYKDGVKFYLAANGVWLADEVPAKYISVNM